MIRVRTVPKYKSAHPISRALLTTLRMDDGSRRDCIPSQAVPASEGFQVLEDIH
jgi:hypothetical protein